MQEIKKIIVEEKLFEILDKTKKPDKKNIEDILEKAAEKKGLNLEEIGNLLNVEDREIIENMFEVSGKIKEEIYGNRLVFFAPLYLSSYCINDCSYCGFKNSNKNERKKLNLEEVVEQTKKLMDMGHKRLLLEFGEDPKRNPIDYVVDVIKTIYKTAENKGRIDRVNINIAATNEEDYKKLKEVGIGTYQLFQETYHQETYKKMHSKGPKSDFKRQLFAHDRAIKAGLDDVGLGVLFGLFDPKFEVLALASHSDYLERTYGFGSHTISVPKFQNAEGVNLKSAYKINDDELLKIISIIRMAVPYTGMIISTRESEETRKKAFEIGISQTSAASNTQPGGYGKEKNLEQFITQDKRGVDETIESILEQGFMPSFCTACYGLNRTGATIMGLIKGGEINNLCNPNAILSLQEYLNNYGTDRTKELGKIIIEKSLSEIDNETMKIETLNRLDRIKFEGANNLYF